MKDDDHEAVVGTYEAEMHERLSDPSLSKSPKTFLEAVGTAARRPGELEAGETGQTSDEMGIGHSN